MTKQPKPCRVCDDLKSWSSAQKTLQKPAAKADPRASDSLMPECPPDSAQLGNATWTLLHSAAAYYPDSPTLRQQHEMYRFIQSFSQIYPCNYCAKDFQDELRIYPPDVSSRSKLEMWMCQRHNAVNRKLGKEEFDCRMIGKRWKEGDEECNS